jgi:putative solute:sodium symporter small subunit
MENNNDYHISFFKPTTEQARYNRNLVLLLVCLWAVAVFGFHFLLRAIEKPTPEAALVQFEQVWDNVETDNASTADYQALAQSSLSVLGKIFMAAEDKTALNNALSFSVFQLCDSAQKVDLFNEIAQFEKIKSEITLISDPAYIQAKNSLVNKISPIIGLEQTDVRTKIMPVELVSAQMKAFDKANIEILPQVMQKYLIHYQSFLTDTTFLGFPFHYFYSAVFLLILFVFLCWLYCVRVDRRNKILNIQD